MKTLLSSWLLAVAALGAGLFAAAAAGADKPNFVLIFADDLGINDLSCYGRKDQRTPISIVSFGLTFQVSCT